MAKKQKTYKVHVHTAFNLIMPEGVTEKPFRKFEVGTHDVTAPEYNHPWLQQHAEPIDEIEDEAPGEEPASEEAEETAEGEETSEETAEEEEVEETSTKRGNKRK